MLSLNEGKLQTTDVVKLNKNQSVTVDDVQEAAKEDDATKVED